MWLQQFCCEKYKLCDGCRVIHVMSAVGIVVVVVAVVVVLLLLYCCCYCRCFCLGVKLQKQRRRQSNFGNSHSRDFSTKFPILPTCVTCNAQLSTLVICPQITCIIRKFIIDVFVTLHDTVHKQLRAHAIVGGDACCLVVGCFF